MDFYISLKNMDKNIAGNKSENFCVKYNQKLLDHAKQSAVDTLKTASEKSNSKNRRSN